MSNALLVFTRYPEPGKSKTRLIPALGEEGAAEIHRLMAEHTLQTVRAFSRQKGTNVEICFEGGEESLLSGWLGEDLAYFPQCSGDLGGKMKSALSGTFAKGNHRAVVIGTDCPGLTCSILDRAFEALETHDVVLGPARDGGYYLVGLNKELPFLFDGIPWGTENVLETTASLIKSRYLSVELLPTLPDVDRPGDIEILKQALHEIDIP